MNRKHHTYKGMALKIRREAALDAKRRRRPKLLIAVFLMLLYCLSGSLTMVMAEEGTDQTVVMAEAEAQARAAAEAEAARQAAAAQGAAEAESSDC